MAYRQVVNEMHLSPSDAILLIRELDFLRAEMDDMRSKFATLLAKLDADAGVTDTNYGTTCALASAQFTAT